MIFDKRLVKDFDKALLVITFILCLGGVLMLHSATQAKGLIFIESYVFRQINWIVLAAAFLLIVINISYALYAINIVLLMLVLILGRERLGAQRWFTVGNFAFQPSEFIKINFILTLANLLGSKKGRLEDAKMFFIPLVLLAIPFLLVLVQQI